MLVFILNLLINSLIFIQCGYPPIGDEVQMGSVLLPATRRGRYLANIVRRQAVDGTGIKFNKDADRMNAEAKKKVDVLSEELLPYIIAEQERRTTLYKRVMTAIQNGEKGVTIAEIRNKPPLIIRKGLMYRCPANRAPKEPDGSGVILCEDDHDPTPIMYDSCLSAEDKELYVAENKYFFCNRHKIEGPDLPRNGSTVIGCAPLERTSLNYTSGKCALEDTDDVVVHYRYYPDRTYKFVTELDPDREVCDHWNPCQIGYIYSLPSPDQAVPANELWHEYGPEDYEQIVPQDAIGEYIVNGTNYKTSTREIRIPDGFEFHGIGKLSPSGQRVRITVGDTNVGNYGNMTHLKFHYQIKGNMLSYTLEFTPYTDNDAGQYYIRFTRDKEDGSTETKYLDNILHLHTTQSNIRALTAEIVPGQRMNRTRIPLRCGKCSILSLMLRGDDGTISNVDTSKYRIKTYGEGTNQKYLEIDLEETRPEDFGDYFAIMASEDGTEERIKVLSLKITISSIIDSLQPGAHYDKTVSYNCGTCMVEEILCNGQSVLSSGRVTVTPGSSAINFNYPSFEDEHACVYIGVFKLDDRIYKKIVAIVENASVKIPNVDHEEAPQDGEPFTKEIPFVCDGDCSVERVTVNGVPLMPQGSSRHPGSGGTYSVQGNNLVLSIPNFNFMYKGIFQAVILTPSGRVTKNILFLGEQEIGGAPAAEGDAATPVPEEAAPADAPTPGSDAPPADPEPAAPETEAPAPEGGETSPEEPTTESETPDPGTRMGTTLKA